MSNTIMPIAVEQIMREHMERADAHRRVAAVRAERRRSAPRARVRRTLGALVGRPA